MALSNFISWLTPKRRKPEGARSELQANAEKALRMKQESGAGAKIPPHQTANEGMRDESPKDIDRTSEGGHTPQMKRSKVSRSGDAS
jgi:hypothetical protein